MSAMPPSASQSAGPIGFAAQALAVDRAAAVPAPAAEAASVFADHFRRLLGKSSVPDAIHAGLLPGGADAASTATPAAVPADALATLLPFLDTLGLTQTTAATVIPAPFDKAADARQTPAPFAAPFTAAARHAAAAPAISAATAAPQEAVLEFADILPGAAHDAKDRPGARELAAQLVTTAVGIAREAQPAQAATATAVPGIVAQVANAGAMEQDASAVVSRSVGTPGWAEEIGNRVVWLANRSEGRAELVLTPPQMGRVEISLTVKGDQVTASFASHNPVVREALEAAMPRLREALAEAGIQLGQTQVGAENARQWTQQEKHGDNPGSDRSRGTLAFGASSPASLGHLSTTAGLKGGRGFVDVFA